MLDQPLRAASEREDGEAGTEIIVEASDGFPLAATVFQGASHGPMVLVSGATAVPRGLYVNFARACVASGARAAMVYDYRGVGGSKRPQGWRKRLNYRDWALLDLPAAAARLDEIAPAHPMVGVGQSFGGQALGLSGIADRFERYGMVATMSGYHALLDDPTVWVRMNLIGVPVSYLYSSMPRWMGLGEPIPSSCFRDWARWCRHPEYFFGDPQVPEVSRIAAVTTPILTLGMSDDPWGNPRATAKLMSYYSNAPVETRWLSPQNGGADKIGHLGFFRSRFAETLWPQFIAWLLEGKQMTMGQAG